jgi:hypothetical protein
MDSIIPTTHMSTYVHHFVTIFPILHDIKFFTEIERFMATEKTHVVD